MSDYKTIEGVRFDEQVSTKDIKKILRILKNPNLKYFERDIRTRLEHELVGGSCAFAPLLTPFAYAAGTMNAEQINQKRAKQMDRGYVTWDRAGRNTTADLEARKELYEQVHRTLGKLLFNDRGLDLNELYELRMDVRTGRKEEPQELRGIVDAFINSGISDLAFYRGMSPLNPKTGRTGFPFVIKIASDDKKLVIEDQEFLSRFKFATPYEDRAIRAQLGKIEEGITAFVDDQGYIFKK